MGSYIGKHDLNKKHFKFKIMIENILYIYKNKIKVIINIMENAFKIKNLNNIYSNKSFEKKRNKSNIMNRKNINLSNGEEQKINKKRKKFPYSIKIKKSPENNSLLINKIIPLTSRNYSSNNYPFFSYIIKTPKQKNERYNNSIEEIKKNNIEESLIYGSRNYRIEKPQWFDYLGNFLNEKKDKYIPKGLKFIEYLVKTGNTCDWKSFSFKKENNSLYNKLKKNESDIFNLKNNKKETFQKLKESKSFSNIFNINNINEISRNNNIKYNGMNESNSEWYPKNIFPNLVNYSSVKFNLISPNMKNTGKTKEEIIKEIREISPNFNVTDRQKSISEYRHLSSFGSPNPNKEYMNAFNKNPKVFYKYNELL